MSLRRSMGDVPLVRVEPRRETEVGRTPFPAFQAWCAVRLWWAPCIIWLRGGR